MRGRVTSPQMQSTDLLTKLFEVVTTSGYLPLIPIFLWNIAFMSKLPRCYQPDVFNINIPRSIIVSENVFRIIIFTIPLFFSLNKIGPIINTGVSLYILGTALYFISWLLLIISPNSRWSRSIVGFTAPAYTPIIWLVGISLMVDSCYLFTYSKWHFLLPATLFSVFHVIHVIYVYKDNYGQLRQ